MSDEARIKIDAMFKYPIQVTNHEAKQKAYIAGATAERPKAWNEAIDESLELLIHYSGAFTSVKNFESLKSELEALKHKQP